ncbi:MAG: tail fiber domain-containing protein [Verrucomicrobiota bacterium]
MNNKPPSSKIWFFIGGLWVWALAGAQAQTPVPGLLHFQGRVTVNGAPFQGTGQFKFALVDGEGTSLLWGNAADVSPSDGVPDAPVALPVDKGLYAVLLGDSSRPNMASVPASVFQGPDVRLRVWFSDGVHGFELLNPDQRLAAAGYALAAENANHATTAENLANDPRFTGESVFDGRVGIGTNTPSAELEVKGTAKATRFVGDASELRNIDINNIFSESVVAWGGANAFGELTVPAGLKGVVAVAAGRRHSVALKSDGTVVCWGKNDFGQTNVPANLTGVVAIDTCWDATAALRADGTVVVWGATVHGQTDVPANLTGVVAVAMGIYHVLALKADGTVVAWGDNIAGQTAVPPNLTGVKAIATSSIHSVALKQDGTVVAWGHNQYGQSTPPAGLSDVVAIAAGDVHTLALKRDGTVVGWGNNGLGQAEVPAGLAHVVAISAGNGYNFAIRADGTVVGWGQNDEGQMNVPVGLAGVRAIGTGEKHVIALRRTSPVPRLDEDNAFFGHLTVTGDLGINYSHPQAALHVRPAAGSGDALLLGGDTVGGGETVLAAGLTAARNGAGYIQAIASSGSAYGHLLLNPNEGRVGIGVTGTPSAKLEVNGEIRAGAFNTTSDRNTKENFRLVDSDEVLAKIRALPISQWNFKSAPADTHLGPMAQDFYAAFGLGADDKHIATVDADGVAFAAIQGLADRLEESLRRKDTEIAELRERLGRLEGRLAPRP